MDSKSVCQQCETNVSHGSCDCEVKENGENIKLYPVECRMCGQVLFISNTAGIHKIDCNCGFKDVVLLRKENKKMEKENE